MLKILYAAANNENARIQLARFVEAIKDKPFIVKIAAYKNSSPKNQSIDWTLDCLQNIFNPEHISLDNDNLTIYYNQIKAFAPDLIISDLEYFTSHLANELNITLWQCSSSIINFALSKNYKYDLGIFSKYGYLLNKNPTYVQRIINIIDNSNCNFIYSHFGDTNNVPEILGNFEWVRPYHQIGKLSPPCQHNVVAALPYNNKNILNILSNYPDSIIFSEFLDEKYDNLSLKNINNHPEYYCNIKNSRLFLTQGQSSFLADAFYNSKYSVVFPDLQDIDCVFASTISEKLQLSKSIYGREDLSAYMDLRISSKCNEKIKFLHEKIEEI